MLSFQYHSRFAGRPTRSRFLTQGVQGDLRQEVKVPDRRAADRLSASNAEAYEARSQPHRHNKSKARNAV